MKKNSILLLVLGIIFIVGCAEKPIGGERDEHGCLSTAGYTWCESKQKCLRTWEEECPSPPPKETGLTPEECIAKGGRTVNIVGGDTCKEDELNIGPVVGFISPNICCIPREGEKMTLEEAIEIVESGECTEKGQLTDKTFYNEDTDTWWIDLDMKEEFKKEYCNPACVVYEVTKTAEINWRCMGALPPE